MKTLTLVRHGDYSGEDLNEYGRKQMEKIGQLIAEKVPSGGTFALLTSAAPRASQSAAVIGEALGIPVNHRSEHLWSDNRHWQDDEKFQEELHANRGNADHVIVVSHLEYLKDLPAVFTKDFQKPAGRFERSKGSGVIIRFEEKSFEEIRG